ncbi:hypothetical protein GTW08_06205, partial [Pseudonocardia sp. SID8383]|nr:hypothetical protein [Pseudonocardia sp. SID8383]
PEPAELFRPASDSRPVEAEPKTSAVPRQDPRPTPGDDAERTVAVGAVRRSGDTPTDGSQKPPAGDKGTSAESTKADAEPPTTANPAAGRGPARPGPEGARNGSGQAGHGQNGRNGASSASEPSSQGGEKGNGATRNGSGAATGDKGRTGAAQPSTGTRSS